MFFKTDSERAATQAAKARKDAGAASASTATGARNLGAVVLAALAEATAPEGDSSKKHAGKAKANAMKAADKNRVEAAKAARKAGNRSAAAAKHGRKAAAEGGDSVLGHVAAFAGTTAAGVTGAAAQAGGTVRDTAVHAAEVVRDRADGSAVAGAVTQKAGIAASVMTALAAAARERATAARDRAVAGMDQGIDSAVPRAQEGVGALAPKVDNLRDVINEELLPKIQAMLGDVQTGKDRVLAQDQGVVAALTGAPKAKGRKGGFLITLGLLAAAGAGAAWYLDQQQRKPVVDPWATPAPLADTTVADPWDGTATAPASGAVATSEGQGAHLATTTGVTTTTTAATADSADAPHILQPEEIDALAEERPLTAEEQPGGESPRA